MPQGRKTAVEEVQFKAMLGQINVLYACCKTLILLDLSYISRFWRARRAPATTQEPPSHARTDPLYALAGRSTRHGCRCSS